MEGGSAARPDGGEEDDGGLLELGSIGEPVAALRSVAIPIAMRTAGLSLSAQLQ